MRLLRTAFWLLAYLAVTGLVLMFVYSPEYSASADASLEPAETTLGSFFRGLHFWAAQFIVLVALAHLSRVVFVKTNRQHSGWAVALVIFIGLFWVTGMVLPWDQLTDWVHQMGGPLGRMSGQDALLTIYWTHSLALSVLLTPLVIAYARRMCRDLAAAI